ncbi:FecR domain-containing protein [Draconibacterium orientale]|uniref:FecR family protein n=1 Tax=Draconibacterium orientale TaxID=1168034 RepID=UPI002ABD866E|nr:FecR domain-containing protein [Draconibacterium orientale]
MDHKTDIEQLIIRYLDNDCSIAERQQLHRWLGQSNKNKTTFYTIKDIWDVTLKKEDNTSSALLQFYRQQSIKNNTSANVIRIWKAVAGVAAVLAIGIISFFILQKISLKETGLSTLAEVSFKVPMGSRSEVNLPDGTTVVLNSGSELRYPPVFVEGKREVSLAGEAFFDVKLDKTNPFVVKTSDFDVQVTGTQFNVCTYDDDNTSSVTLKEGKVGVQFSESSTFVDIVPGQRLSLSRKNQKYHVAEIEVETETAWKDGEFRFKEIAFSDLIKRLERWYNVKLYHTAPELEQMLYRGNFKNQETIWQVLDALKLTSPIDYEKTGFREFKIIYKPM